MTGTKIITMLGALLALVLVGGSQTDANAQGRPTNSCNVGTNECQCNEVWTRGKRLTATADDKTFYALLTECAERALVGVGVCAKDFAGQCKAKDREGDCGGCYRAVHRAYQRCRHAKTIKASREFQVAKARTLPPRGAAMTEAGCALTPQETKGIADAEALIAATDDAADAQAVAGDSLADEGFGFLLGEPMGEPLFGD